MLAAPLDAPTGVWAPAPVAPDDITAISAFTGGTAYVQAGTGDDVQLLRTQDAGVSWTAVPIATTTGTWTEIRFGSRTFGAILADDTVGATLDAGRTWSTPARVTVAPGQEIAAGTAHLAVHRTTVLVTGAAPSERQNYCNFRVPSAVAVSEDRLRHWRVSFLPLNMTVTSISMLDSRHIAVVAEHMRKASAQIRNFLPCAEQSDGRTALFLSDDGGRSFRRILTAHDATRKLTSVALVSPERIVVGLSDGTVRLGTSAGRTFGAPQSLRGVAEEDPSPAADSTRGVLPVTDLSFSGRTGYAYVASSGVWRTTDGGAHWQHEPSIDTVTAPAATGTVAAFDADHALAGGAKMLEFRVPA